VHDEVGPCVAAPEVPDVNRALAAPQRQTVFDGERREDDLERGRFGQIALDERDGARVARALLPGQRLAVERLVLLKRRAHGRDEPGPARQGLLAVRRADRRQVFERARVAHELDAGEGFRVDLVAQNVVFVPVSVDDVPDRLRRQPPERGQHLLRRGRADVRVNDDHVRVVDDEDDVGVEPQPQRLSAERGVDAFGDLHRLELLRLSECDRRRRDGDREQTDAGQEHDFHSVHQSRKAGQGISLYGRRAPPV
jgi:hypothetical protein